MGRITRPRLIPEIRDAIRHEVEVRRWPIITSDRYFSIAWEGTEALRDSLAERGLSKKDLEFNLRVLHIAEIAVGLTSLDGLNKEKYGCGSIMATSLGLKEVRRNAEETKQFVREASHPEDKEALEGLVYLLDRDAGQTYRDRLVGWAAKVDAVLLVDDRMKPNLELIEARFALDSIWDEKRSMRLGAPQYLRRRATKRSRQLDGDPNVAKTRRSLDIPPDGFKDLDAAHQWAQSEKRPPDWSCRDDAYWQELLWWESFTWDRQSQRHVARGYIMLDLPPMNEAVEQILDEHQWHRRWYRVLPLYLIRGRLEPPPRERYKPCFKAVLSYRHDLSDKDWSEIERAEPAASKRWWSKKKKPLIEEQAIEIAKRKGTYDIRRHWLTEDHVRTIRYRMRALE